VLEHILCHVATVLYGDFEWDDEKAAFNQAKHGVSFEEAATALVDPNALFLADDSADEDRLVAIGMSKQTRVLFVVHVVRGERDRIVSARLATDAEEAIYEQGS
jgi:uncharacterized protein